MRILKGKAVLLGLAAGLSIGPVLAQFPPIFGGGIPVVDATAVIQLIKQLEQAVAMHELSGQQLQQLLLTVARLTSQLEQMKYNARTFGNLSSFRSFWSLWYLVSAANTYGHNLGWINAANGQTTGLAGYNASVMPLPVYGTTLGTLAASTVQRIQYQYSAAQLGDSVAQTALTTSGAVRSSAAGREAALNNLRDATLEPTASEVQVLQKTNAAVYMQARLQNDTNKLLAAQTDAVAFQAKQQRDAIEAAASERYDVILRSGEVTASTANASAIIHSFHF